MVPEQTMEDENILQDQRLVPCGTCGRTFLPQALKKHAPICEKHTTKKRKVFDSLKQRVEGTDLAQFHQKSYLKKQQQVEAPLPKPAEVKKRTSRWEENHQRLVDAIRNAKGASREMSPVTKKLPSSTSLNERCPFCERHFGPKAFDRHVEWCKEHRSRIQRSPANVLQAKERLEARTKYKVPPLNKSKRAVVKEKYSSPSANRTDSVCSLKSTPSVVHTPVKTQAHVRKPKSVMEISKLDHVALPIKLSPPEKKAVKDNKNVKDNKRDPSPYDPFVTAERQFRELMECDLTKPSTKQSTRPKTVVQSVKKTVHKPAAVKSAASNNKRASVIDPPAKFQDADSVDDDFEMLENLLNNHFNDNDDFFADLNKQSRNCTNARKLSDDVSSIDSNLINENDNLSIPEHFKLDNYSPTTDDTDTTIRNDDFFSSREKKSSKSSNNKTKTKSDSSYGDDGHAADSPRKEKIITKFNKDSSPEEEAIKPEDLFAVDDEMYAEYKIYEEMYLKEKEQKTRTKKHKGKNSIKSYGIDLTLEETSTNSNKISDDSAYGSLNRSTANKPKPSKLSPLQRKRIDSASSSGSENVPNSPVVNTRMSKFCHECGNKFPLTTAKFCVECGVKRLVL